MSIFVGRLPLDTRRYELEDLFSRYGRLLRCDVKRGFGFIDNRDGDDAIKALDGSRFLGERIVVEWSKSERYERKRRRSHSRENSRSLERSRRRSRSPSPKRPSRRDSFRSESRERRKSFEADSRESAEKENSSPEENSLKEHNSPRHEDDIRSESVESRKVIKENPENAEISEEIST